MNIAKRIEKIEALIRPVPGAILLREPPVDAPDAEFAEHAEKIEEAIFHDFIVVVVRNGSDRQRRNGVTYVDDDFNGWLAVFANSPATDGRSSDRLSQVIREVQGTSLPVVHEVPDDGEI